MSAKPSVRMNTMQSGQPFSMRSKGLPAPWAEDDEYLPRIMVPRVSSIGLTVAGEGSCQNRLRR